MNTASFTEHSFSPTVPLLGSQGWIVAPPAAEPRAGIVALLREWLDAAARATSSTISTTTCCATSG